jgi:hypothetical protein
MFANHPKIAKEFADETPEMKELPEKKKKNEMTERMNRIISGKHLT